MMRAAQVIAGASLIALIFLCVAWELWLAPVRAGGSAMALKALPLLLPLFGVLHGKRYTYQWSSMLIFAYFAEGVVRAWSERGSGRVLAITEIVLSLLFFTAAVWYARASAGKWT
ncbi:MAG TPA: DUF2069 domain-containing protein [Burkholderiales bacterium]|nr:DUF2069 domain-containing protein [Burkholderiales bacterium]